MSRGSSRSSRYSPWRHAAALGVGVAVVSLDDGHLGWWCHRSRTIHLEAGLTRRQSRSVLAHEVVHAEHDDRPLLDPVLHARREAATDRAAAARLIDFEQLLDGLLWAASLGELAEHLGVDVHTARVRLSMLTEAEVETARARLSDPTAV